MESSSPAQAGNQAILESPLLTAPKGGQCIKFFYNMYGITMGSLFVVLQEHGKPAETIFYKTGDQGLDWIGAEASLDIPEGRKFKVTMK